MFNFNPVDFESPIGRAYVWFLDGPVSRLASAVQVHFRDHYDRGPDLYQFPLGLRRLIILVFPVYLVYWALSKVLVYSLGFVLGYALLLLIIPVALLDMLWCLYKYIIAAWNDGEVNER